MRAANLPGLDRAARRYRKVRNKDGKKQCLECDFWWPLEAFNVDRAKKDGRGSYCLKCGSDRRAAPLLSPEGR